jgi:DNA-binding NarL/FixJ family response regulator
MGSPTLLHPEDPRRAAAGSHPRCVVVVMDDVMLGNRIVDALVEAGIAPLHAAIAPMRRDRRLKVEVVVLAGSLDRTGTIATLRRLQRDYSRSVVVIVAPCLHPLEVRRALNAGACGFVEADHLDAKLAPTVHAVHAGQICAPRLARRAFTKPSFSMREKQVVALVATGATNAQIAARLYLSESTVKSHIASIFDKLGVHSRNDIAALVHDPDEGLGLAALPSIVPFPAQVA